MSWTIIDEISERPRLRRIGDVLRSAWRRGTRQRGEAIAAERLARLDAHLLSDIGIDRADIGSAVRTGRR